MDKQLPDGPSSTIPRAMAGHDLTAVHTGRPFHNSLASKPSDHEASGPAVVECSQPGNK